MMRVHTKTVWQMTEDGYRLVEDEAMWYSGEVEQCKTSATIPLMQQLHQPGADQRSIYTQMAGMKPTSFIDALNMQLANKWLKANPWQPPAPKPPAPAPYMPETPRSPVFPPEQPSAPTQIPTPRQPVLGGDGLQGLLARRFTY